MKVYEILVLLMVVLPFVAYFVMKFGTAGYLRAKKRDRERKVLLCRENENETK